MATEEEEGGKIKIEDSNMDGYGGEEHRAKQKEIADKMPEWEGVGQKEGTQVWRIEKFKVKHWPKEDYGTFFAGDSFIVLHTYKEEDGDELLHNVHFWLGENTSQDEAGAAAIKTVELDDKLGDLPVQYRQVQGHETKEFFDVFPTMDIKEGGVASGFKHVTPETYQKRLIHVFTAKKKGKKKQKVRSKQIKLTVNNLNNNDTFLLDAGTTLFAFYPPKASVWEKRGCLEKLHAIEAERNGKVKQKHVVNWSEGAPSSPEETEFWGHFPEDKPDELADTCEYMEKKAAEEAALEDHVNKMYHITGEEGNISCEVVGEGQLDYDMLAKEDDDVLVVDVGRIVFIWIGSSANREEISHAMQRTQTFLHNSGRPLHTPIKRICSGKETPDFKKAFGCEKAPKDICN